MKNQFANSTNYVQNGKSHVCSICNMENDNVLSQVFLVTQKLEKIQLTEKVAHYDSLSAIQTDKGVFCTYSSLENGNRTMYLSLVKADNSVITKILSINSKTANAKITERNSKICIVFESYEEVYTNLILIEIDKETLDFTQKKITRTKEPTSQALLCIRKNYT